MNVRKLLSVVIAFSYFLFPCWQWSETHLYTFIATYFPMFQSQDTLWFFSERLSTKHTENLDASVKRIHEVTKVPQFVFTNRSDLRLTNIDSKRNSMVVVFTTGSSDPIMHVHNRMLTRRHIGLSIVVYVDKVANLSVIEDVCYILYKGSFVNSMVFFETTEGSQLMYGYRQYPSFSVINQTDFQKYLQEQYAKAMAANQDVEGYRFYTPLRLDLPYVIKYRDKQGEEHLEGTMYRILKEFIDGLNGSMVEYKMPEDNLGGEAVNMKAVLELVRRRELDVVAHAYALYDTDDDLDKSYPIMVVKWCLMVPVMNSISTFLYPIQPFSWEVWLSVGGVLLALCLLDYGRVLWETKVFRRRYKFYTLLSEAWLNDFCYVLYVATPKALTTPSWLRFLIFGTIFFFGFFLSANYTSFLGTFLTVTLFRAQINTMDDIIRLQLPIMIIDYELVFLYSQGYILPQNFSQLLRPVDPATFALHQLQFNTSFGYFVTDDVWHFLNEAQRHLKQRVFKFSDICFGSYHLAYPIQTDSAVWRDLEYFTFRTHSNGLIQKYEQEAFQYSLAAKYIQRLEVSHEYTSAGLQHLFLIFFILFAMCGLSALCFLLELVVHKMHYLF
ncbi:ionotropic receptor 56c [Haematobia irritans]|uniref:ionotropic receptor 56c n=1 Tax=Haematobia irritans TaxID=7368 RepID=UPI003F4FD525